MGISNMKKNDNIGYCGLDCSKCECYIATVKDDDELRKKVAKKWSKLNNVEIPYQAMNCLGCKQDDVKSGFCEFMCEVRKCATAKQYDNCMSCLKKNDCSKLQPFLNSDINTFKKN